MIHQIRIEAYQSLVIDGVFRSAHRGLSKSPKPLLVISPIPECIGRRDRQWQNLHTHSPTYGEKPRVVELEATRTASTSENCCLVAKWCLTLS